MFVDSKCTHFKLLQTHKKKSLQKEKLSERRRCARIEAVCEVRCVLKSSPRRQKKNKKKTNRPFSWMDKLRFLTMRRTSRWVVRRVGHPTFRSENYQHLTPMENCFVEMQPPARIVISILKIRWLSNWYQRRAAILRGIVEHVPCSHTKDIHCMSPAGNGLNKKKIL